MILTRNSQHVDRPPSSTAGVPVSSRVLSSGQHRDQRADVWPPAPDDLPRSPWPLRSGHPAGGCRAPLGGQAGPLLSGEEFEEADQAGQGRGQPAWVGAPTAQPAAHEEPERERAVPGAAGLPGCPVTMSLRPVTAASMPSHAALQPRDSTLFLVVGGQATLQRSMLHIL